MVFGGVIAAVGSIVGGVLAADSAKDARRDARAQEQRALDREERRNKIAALQARSELRRLGEAPTRVEAAPQSVGGLGVSIGQLQAGLTLGESTGLIVPMAP